MRARAPEGQVPPPLSSLRVALVVAALMTAYALSFVDRQILALLVEPVQDSLGISDTSFGLIQGLAFALFYFGFGIPLGRMADRGSRRNLIAAGILMWSVMTMMCGTAQSFLALFAWRAGVGIGEAALSPAAYSMIADMVPKRRLSFVLALYSSGVHVGAGLALLVGGFLLNWIEHSGAATWMAGAEPWRLVFFLVGAPGIAMAAIMLLLPEPPRRQFGGAVAAEAPSIRETVELVIRERRLFAGLIFGFAFHNGIFFALLSWMPTFVERVHGLSPGEFGTQLGLATAVGGVLGLLSGGLVSDRLVASGRQDTPIVMGLAAMAGMLFCALAALYGGSTELTFAFFGAAMFFQAAPIGTIAAALQLVVPNRFRGQISALYLISISIAGMTLGPALPPLISDSLFRDPARIGDALAITLVVMAAAGILFLLNGRSAYARRYASIHHPDSERGPI
ncbi:MFS transporter [Sphingopyxis sp. JAI128]|uniref:MFS transporter n=1 Tax=Sphingopyxis sp. JAI128 TaxID=2723066 RepID=UPI00161215A9|nr:MFS transporter [Sphingopyxis sp. JAI128]MBB6427855.1 MFS family permease [Sphingopyxis sp. JAI128]